MQQDHMYSPLNTFSSNEDEDSNSLTQYNEEITDMRSNVGDALLIDLIKGYPHLYNKTSSNYKDLVMKENSWEEIAQIMRWTPAECQNRWIRLRERFSKERRQMEIETRSGSGISLRKGFPLYENMKFLNDHVQRRRTFTNINKENNPRTSSNACSTVRSPIISQSYVSPKSNLDIKSAYTLKQRNRELLNIVETNVHDKYESTSFETYNKIQKPKTYLSESNNLKKHTLITPSTTQESDGFETHSAIQKPETCMSEGLEFKKTLKTPTSHEQESSTSSTSSVQASNKYKTSLKRPRLKEEPDDIEKSFLLLSAEIKEKLQNTDVKPVEKKDEKDIEDKFAELITAELRKLPETQRQDKKKEIINILWS